MGATDDLTLNWSTAGVKTVVVTATTGITHARATRTALLFDVEVSGLTQGTTNHEYTFNTNLTPSTTGFPITYTWEATNQSPVVHPDQDTVDSAAFNWPTPGTMVVTVTATIEGATAQAEHTIEIEEIVLDEFVFLPLVQR